MTGFEFMDRPEVVQSIKDCLSYIQLFSEKINFFIPTYFKTISKEKMETVLLDPKLKSCLLKKVREMGYNSLFLQNFFEHSQETSKSKFSEGGSLIRREDQREEVASGAVDSPDADEPFRAQASGQGRFRE